MRAAVVRAFDAPPRFDTFPTPIPSGEHEVLVDVLAAGLHPRVRSAANGSHYTSDGTLPLVPGIDAVGRTPQGELLYFAAPDAALGTMAEHAVVDRRRAITLPTGTDPAAVAAAMNPGMSSWVALRRRVSLPPGGSVLVMGATGNAGQLAVQIAKHLGAARVIGAGRDPRRLDLLKSLGADEVVRLDDSDSRSGSGSGSDDVAERLARAAADVDVVIDYLWGRPTEQAMPALLTARSDRSKALAWVQIGSMAGQDITLPSYLLRAANLNIMGSGQGSLTTAGIIAELPSLAAEIASGALAVDPLPMPLDQVEQAWNTPTAPGQRLVLTPSQR
ncbi:zinc-binding alcohol dehydrogenase family protein [Nonomuraea sp. NPDC050022]|uniref:zinc-binding alcohol dehydrogenase family protein n=1 Tax=Nonomuraea sp. NPDC050022 TaxID=3364358 RepID=UPI0037A0D9D5